MDAERIDVRVIHESQVVRGLKWSDFKVTRSETTIPIAKAVEADEPLDILLMLDTSGALVPLVDVVEANAELAVVQTKPADRIAVSTFADSVSIKAAFTDNHDAVLRVVGRTLDRADKWSGGNIDVAVQRATEYIGKNARPDARRVILFITGNDHYRELEEVKLQDAVFASGAVLNAALISTGTSATEFFKKNPQEHADIRKLVAVSGGYLVDGNRPGTAMQALIEALRTRYVLDCDLKGNTEGVMVTLSDLARQVYPGAEVRSKVLTTGTK